MAEYQKTVVAAEEANRASQQASDVARNYVAITILLAVALFFAGVTASFRYRPARASLLIAALGTVAVAAVQLADLPTHVSSRSRRSSKRRSGSVRDCSMASR